MRVKLKGFQEDALQKLRKYLAAAVDSYERHGERRVISLTAPTGAGKTMIAAALIEAVLQGDEGGMYPEAPNSIFLWLSDSPELNEQSKRKITSFCAPVMASRCKTIAEESFDQPVLEDGWVYFLNTQKLSVKSKLVQHGDGRTHTIWETLNATVRQKGERLFLIIDEAHRGMLDKRATEATTIMQKFIKGSAELDAMPIAIGMSATIERFNKLVSGIDDVTQNKVKVNKDDVIDSGLLKEKIILAYPESGQDAYATLHAAAVDWKDKREHWQKYSTGYLFGEKEKVNPVFIVQVQNQAQGLAQGLAQETSDTTGGGAKVAGAQQLTLKAGGSTDTPKAGKHEGLGVSLTDLGRCVSIIEDNAGVKFDRGQVVHTFGTKSALKLPRGFVIPYKEPSEIAGDENVMLVFFKENLSTGWDCPRAETMMSFRRATDATYIAQLLGRMVRTPLGRRIAEDETLNDVRLFLPFFDKDTVQEVANELKKEDITTVVDIEPISDKSKQTLTRKYTKRDAPAEQLEMFDNSGNEKTELHPAPLSDNKESTEDGTIPPSGEGNNVQPATPNNGRGEKHTGGDAAQNKGKLARPAVKTPPPAPPKAQPPVIDRQAVADFINHKALPTSWVGKPFSGPSRYLRSFFALSRLLTQSEKHIEAVGEAKGSVAERIRAHKEALEEAGKYKRAVQTVAKIRLSMQQFDIVGEQVDDKTRRFSYDASEREIDRMFSQAEAKLGGEGVANEYGRRYGDEKHPEIYKIDVILFAMDEECMQKLEAWAKGVFTAMADRWRVKLTQDGGENERRFNEITCNADTVSTRSFRLPETIQVAKDEGGKLYANHLFVDEQTGVARIKLNGWEEALISEEERRGDFVCWIRNVQNAPWALCLTYETQNEIHKFYPDFIVVRKNENGYIMDILEPHGPQYADNIYKAKALLDYARGNHSLGRVQLIRMAKDDALKERLKRLDFASILVQDKAKDLAKTEELDHLFDTTGFFG